MKLTLNIRSIRYDDIAIRLLPLLKARQLPANALGKLLGAVLELPRETIRTVFQGIPETTQNEIVALLVQENHSKLIGTVNDLLDKQALGMAVDTLCLTRDLECQVTMAYIDYAALAAKFLPLVGDGTSADPTARVLARLRRLPGSMLRGAVDLLPQETKDRAVVYLLEKNRALILRKLTELAAGQGIRVELEDLKVSC